jgi:hypothetical protein
VRRSGLKRILGFALVAAGVAGGLALALELGLIAGRIHLPKRMVLQARIPGSHSAVELWERPGPYIGLSREYETWFVVRSAQDVNWYLIDDRYITFTDVTVFVSSDSSKVRVEVTEIGKHLDSHMIAKYDFARKEFRAESSEPSVRDTRGWEVLAAAHIH